VPALIVRDGPSAGHRVEVAEETVLGRADSAFLQHDTEVSRRHAAVRASPEGLVIEDLGSSNGTLVNALRISSPTPLRSGDVVTLGQTTFDVEVEPAAQPTTVRETMSPPPEVPTPADQAPPPAGPPATELVPSVAPPSAYGPPRSPAAYGARAAYGVGARPGAITAAGIILLVVGVGTLLYNGWDVFLLFQDLDLATSLGLGGLLWTLIVIDIFLLLFAVFEIIGGIRSFALGRAGRVLGVIGAIGVIAAWIAFVVVVAIEGLTVNSLAWIVLVLSIGGSAAALIMLLSAGRHFASRS
jgi:pSer/pThr/pTyr-binding forkhead associated (FHA) protein